MPTLSDLCAEMKTLCDGLYSLRHSPRPADRDWRTHRPSLDEAGGRNDECQKAADRCLSVLEAVAQQLPAAWLGDDPGTSEYICLKGALRTVGYWLHECQRPFRGYKMPMDSPQQDQHDDPADIKSWEDAERMLRRLSGSLRDYSDLEALKGKRPLAPLGLDAVDRLVHYAEAYLAQLKDGGSLSFGLATRVNEAAVALGLQIPFPTPEHGTGANALSLYAFCNDAVGEQAGRFRIVGPDGAPIPLSEENRARVAATLRNLIAEARASAVAKPAEPSPTGKPKLLKDEANIKAREYLRQHPKATVRAVAEGIGCSTGMVSQLPAWKAVQGRREQGRASKKAKIVSLTPKLERTAGTEDEQLSRLIGEQEVDAEPSPLQDDLPEEREGAPRKAKVYRRR